MAKALDSSRMGVMHEGRLLLTMAVPMMLSMIVQALYNVVDSTIRSGASSPTEYDRRSRVSVP